MDVKQRIVDITADNFEQEVIQASQETLIMLDFWATWCGPCQALIPQVTKLAEEYNGAFILAKVDIDQNPELATQYSVRGVPSVKFIRRGEVVDEFTGALPESEIRNFIDKHVDRESDQLLDAAIVQYEAGETEQAIKAIQDISQQDPHNPRLPIIYSELMIREGKYDVAQEVLNSLSYDARQSEQVVALLAKLEFASTSAGLPDESTLLKNISDNPKDSQARYQLSTLYTMEGQFAQALDQLLEILKYDRQYDDDAARKAILKIFEMLGDSELVHRYRRKMMACLY